VSDVDDYIAGFPTPTRAALEEFRAAVHRAAPGVTETISYRMPTFVLDGRPLVHVAAWKEHIALYPLPAGDPEVDAHRTKAATGRFPLSQPVPVAVVERAVTLLRQLREG